MTGEINSLPYAVSKQGRPLGNWRGEVLILPAGEVAWEPVPTSLGGIAASRLTSSVCVCVRVELLSCVRLFAIPWTVACQSLLLHPWDSPGKTGVGCHALLQGIFPTQGSNGESLKSAELAGQFFTTSATWEAPHLLYLQVKQSAPMLLEGHSLDTERVANDSFSCTAVEHRETSRGHSLACRLGTCHRQLYRQASCSEIFLPRAAHFDDFEK